MGTKALGLHQQRPNVSSGSKKQKSVHPGIQLHGHQFKTSAPDNQFKSHHHPNNFHHHHNNNHHSNQNHHPNDFFRHQDNSPRNKNSNYGVKPPRFQRTASFGDAPAQVAGPSPSDRVRSSSGSTSAPIPANNNIFKPIRKPASPAGSPTRGMATPPKSSSPDGFFAMAKFNDSPEPSLLPKPPTHWQARPFPNTSPCKQEFQMDATRIDGIDFTAHLKTLLKVEM